MSQDPETEKTSAVPIGIGYCAWHKDIARGVRLVRIHEGGSGPNAAGRKFACAPCLEKFGLVPLADRLEQL